MAGDDGTFSIDPDELADIVAELRACQRVLDRNLGDLRRQMTTLQSAWEGLSADAQAVAQAEWEAGHAAMHAALVELTEASDNAHANYTGAIRANVTMWSAVS